MLECLKNLGNGQYEIDKWVLPVLRSSYDFLNNKLQRFFLHCALSTNGCFDDNNTDRLTRIFAYESIYETKKLRVQYNEGYNMLDKLQNHGMLERDDIYNMWRIHKFFRVLAIGIAEGAGKIMAYAYEELAEIPSDDQWKEDLQKVFLTGNGIKTIPDGTCPRCSQLSTLLLDGTINLNYISGKLFNNMPALKILDLSWTGIKHLPESVSNLKCLIALLLSRCGELSYIPSLRKLTRLISLDLSFTDITEAPVGLESLVNLRCLNLLGTDKLVMSASLISELIQLVCLEVGCTLYLTDVTAQVGIHGLEKLEVIVASFRDISVFNTFASFVAQHSTIRSYHLTLWDASYDYPCEGINREYCMKRITFERMYFGNRELVLPGDMKELYIDKVSLSEDTESYINELLFSGDMELYINQGTGARSLCSVLSYGHNNNNNNPHQIERLDINLLEDVEYLCCLSPRCPFCSSTQLVESLSLKDLSELKYLVSPDAHSMDEYSLFHDLTDLSIRGCHSMVTLMTPRLLALLQNLRTISVGCCCRMREIVGEDHSEMELTVILPKLTSLSVFDMRELNSVYRGVMLCPSRALNTPPRVEISRGRALQMEKTEYGCRWDKSGDGSAVYDMGADISSSKSSFKNCL